MRDDNIYLVGFMGAGKTTVAPILGKLLNRLVVDCDQEIVIHAGLPIATLFEEKGEDYFRRLERTIVTSTTKEKNLVVALGGGTFVDDGSRKKILESGIAVYLKTSFASASRRIKNTARPLANEKAQALYESRQAIYEESHFSVETDDKSPEEVAKGIMDILCKQFL